MVEPPLGLASSSFYVLAAGNSTAVLGISSLYLQVIVFVVCIGLVAFFSSAEASLIAVNKLRIRYLEAQGNRSARAVTRVLERHEKFFATILLTENAFIIFAASLGTAVAISLVGENGAWIWVAPLVMTVVIVAFGEITPKTLAAGASERWSLIVARPISLIMYLETFIIYFFTLLPRFLVKVMGSNQGLWAPSVTEGELRMLIDISKAEGAVAESEANLLEKVFRFGDRQMREIMTPRPEIVWLEQGTTLEKFLPLYAEHSHTRFPVYEGSTENVVGVLSSKDVLQALGQDKLQAQGSVTQFLRPAYFVPETKSVSSSFSEMQQSGYGLVLTVDEFGGIAGLATLKQLLEIIVGQVGEEGEAPEEPYTPVDEDTIRLDAGRGISEINEELNLGLPEGEYQTVAGFILDSLGRIPDEGDVVEYQDLRLTVKAMSGVRIDRVELRRLPSGQSEKTR
ncbi:MAG: HlyC/CorC family transporter [Chloroflexi bacterium]|nr:HlyC/CorC family transporter [Chloroflexota bacterium]